MASVATVEEDAHRLEGLAGGVRDGDHGQWPRCGGVLVHCAPKPQASFWVAGIGLLVFIFGSCGLIVLTPVVTRYSMVKPSLAWPRCQSSEVVEIGFCQILGVTGLVQHDHLATAPSLDDAGAANLLDASRVMAGADAALDVVSDLVALLKGWRMQVGLFMVLSVVLVATPV